jgi:hypothetical protein
MTDTPPKPKPKRRRWRWLVVATLLCALVVGMEWVEAERRWTKSIATVPAVHLGQDAYQVGLSLESPYSVKNDRNTVSYCAGAPPIRLMRLYRYANHYFGPSIQYDPSWWPVEVRFDSSGKVNWIRRGHKVIQ